MDGRDIGTVVLPDADLKVYLDATSQERARRRHSELVDRGDKLDVAAVQRDIEARDHQDSNRATSPLRCADDAVRVDSTAMSASQVVTALVSLARDAMASG